MHRILGLWERPPRREQEDFSHSRLKRAGECLWGCYLEYETDEEPDERVSTPGSMGRMVHALVKAYVDHCFETGHVRNTDLVEELLRGLYFEHMGEHGLTAEYWPEVRGMLLTAAAHLYVNELQYIGTELYFHTSVGTFGANLRGTMDIVEVDNQHGIITDLKTEHQVRSTAEVERDPQARRYIWALKREFPAVEEVTFRFLNVRHGVPREVYIPPTELEEFVELVENELLSEIITYEERRARDDVGPAEVWPATPGSWCDYCEYQRQCPTYQTALTDGVPDAILSPSQAAEVAGRLRLLDTQRKALRTPLGDWSSRHGVVVVGDQEWGHFPVHKEETPTAEVVAVLEDAGIDPMPALKFDSKALERLLLEKADGALITRVKSMAVDKSYTQFKSRKHKEVTRETP